MQTHQKTMQFEIKKQKDTHDLRYQQKEHDFERMQQFKIDLNKQLQATKK